MPKINPYLLLTITAAIWGFAFVAQRIGAEHVGALSFNAVRFALGAAVLLPVIWWRGGGDSRGRWRAALRPGLVTGTVLFIAANLQQIGIAQTTAGNAAFITSLYIVLVPILGSFLGRPAAATAWIGVGLAIPGLYLLSVTNFQIGIGDAFQLVGALFWAGHILVVDRYSPRVEVLRFAAIQFATCAGLSLVAASLTETQPLAGLDLALWPILYGGLLSVGIAYTLQVVAQRDADPTIAALIMSFEAVFGALGGAVILGENLGLRGLTGGMLMLLGVLIGQIQLAPRTGQEGNNS